jgi:hypothetical protein
VQECKHTRRDQRASHLRGHLLFWEVISEVTCKGKEAIEEDVEEESEDGDASEEEEDEDEDYEE